jgi:hypothetical protein
MVCICNTLTSGVVARHVQRFGMRVSDLMVLGIARNAYFISQNVSRKSFLLRNNTNKKYGRVRQAAE